MKLGIIGGGKVGTTLGLYLKDELLGITSHSASQSAALSAYFQLPTYTSMELVANASVILITVPDRIIEVVAREIAVGFQPHDAIGDSWSATISQSTPTSTEPHQNKSLQTKLQGKPLEDNPFEENPFKGNPLESNLLEVNPLNGKLLEGSPFQAKPLQGKVFLHCSGSMGLEPLEALKNLGASVGSLHPLQSFATHPLETMDLQPLNTMQSLETMTMQPLGTITMQPIETMQPVETTVTQPIETTATQPLSTAALQNLDTASLQPSTVLHVGHHVEHITKLEGIYMALDGDSTALDIGLKIVKKLKGHPFYVPTKERPLYHAAACLCSNYLVALEAEATKLMNRWAGPHGWDALRPLFEGTVNNLMKNAEKALTGPIARGDTLTVRQHVQILPKELLPLYTTLGRSTTQLALEQHTIDESTAERLHALWQEYERPTR